MIALPARLVIRYRWGVIASWVALAALLVPRAAHVQRVLAVRGGPERPTESTRASDLIDSSFSNPFAEYVAIVVHGPVRDRDDRFVAVLDSLTA
ncbi:MAG TPA: hypothetical protein VNG35_13530, partial [Gemmatimonadales bacterium]|nr:hypothetical protein [Gemmatimonadales bacterium]